MKPNVGKGAIVVPTGFITATSGVEGKILKRIIEEKIVYGCISMPSNVFANTGTNVSVLFFDNSKSHDGIMLVDASSLGEDYQENGLKKKRLSSEEIQKIISAFINNEENENFSTKISYEQAAKKSSLAANHYFDMKVKYNEITPEEFNSFIEESTSSLNSLFEKNHELETKTIDTLKALKYENED